MSNRRRIQGNENMCSSACVQALEQQYCYGCSATVVSRGLGARLVSRIYNGGKQIVYTTTMGAMLAQNIAMPVHGETITVSSGITSTNLSAGSGTEIKVYGTTSSTEVYGAGQETIYSGGVASNSNVNSGGTQIISSGGRVQGTTIFENAYQYVSDGGITYNTVVNSAAYQNLVSGAVGSETVLNSGAEQRVFDGAVAVRTTLNSGGRQWIYSGGTTSTTTINARGEQRIISGGVASDTVINSGGGQNISFGARSYNTTQNSGGNVNVVAYGGDSSTYVNGTNERGESFLLSNGIASNFVINSSGSQNIAYGGIAIDTTINSGGSQYIYFGGRAYNTTQNSGGNIDVVIYENDSSTYVNGINQHGENFLLENGIASNFIINSDGSQNIASGGIAIDTTINSGARQYIYSGGRAYNTIQNSGGNIDVVIYGNDSSTYVNGINERGENFLLTNGIASNFVINSGGSQHIYSSAVASNTTITSGGSQVVYNSGKAQNTWLNSGGLQIVFSGGSAVGTTLNNGTTTIYQGATVNGLTANGGAIYVNGNNTLQGNISLAGAQVNIAHNTSAMNTLTMSHLAADNATFNMNVDLSNQTADKLNITSSYTGNANLKLTEIASGAVGAVVAADPTEGDGIKLVEFGSSATVSGTFALDGGQWDKGGYVYKLEQGTTAGVGKDYYLRAISEYTDTFKTILNIPVMNAMIAQTGMNSLQRRMGDLRGMNNESAQQGIWVRSYYKDMTVKDLAKTDMSLFGAEAGYDWLFMPEEPNKLYAGVMIGFVDATNIKTETQDGVYDKGKGQSPSIGIYATLLNEEGWFVDFAARNFWTKLDMKNHASDGTELSYKPSRNVLATSIEVGKNFNSELSRDRFIRIEPKLELGYMNAAKADANVGNGDGKIEYDATNYVNAKAGVLLGYNAVRDNGLLIEPLVELAYRQEFTGKGNVSYGGATEKSNMSGGTAEINAGLNMQLTNNLYWYGLGSYEASNKVRGWGVYAGIRYAFGEDMPKQKATRQWEKK